MVPGALLLVWLWQVARHRGQARRDVRDRVQPLRAGYTRLGDLAFWLCLVPAVSCCIIALARPQALVTILRKAGADIVILQDGSASMYVTDVTPDRWQRSVKFLRAFANAMSWKDDRVALALFSHSVAPQLRLTKDPNSLFFFLDHLGKQSPFRLQDAPTWDTNIETGISWGLKLVEKDEELFGESKNPKGFVVISDGQAWSGNVAIAVRAARQRNVPVNVVGVGTSQGGLIPEAPGPDGVTPPATIRARLDRDSLRQIATAGGGEYFEIGREPDRNVAVRIIESVRRRARAVEQDKAEESREELYWQFLFVAALLLCLGTLLLKDRAELWWQAAGAAVALLILIGTFG